MMRAASILFLLAVAFAGCSGAPSVPQQQFYSKSDYTISEDNHVAIEFDALSTASVELSILFSGRTVPFDAFVMAPDQFEAWPYDTFSTYGSCDWVINEDTPENLACEIDAGHYYLILENGNDGIMNPPTNGINDKVQVNAMLRVVG